MRAVCPTLRRIIPKTPRGARGKAVTALPLALPPEAMPGPEAYPLVGTIPKHFPGGELFADSLEMKSYIKYKKYGPIVREQLLPGFNHVHLFDPDDFATIYRYEGKYPNRMPMRFFKKYRQERGQNEGFVHSQGEEWHRFRKYLQQIFLRPKTMAAYIPAQGPVADELVTCLAAARDENGEVPDALQEVYKWALESIGVICFDARLGAMNPSLDDNSEAKRFIQAATEGFEAIHKMFFGIPFYLYFNSPTYKKFSRNMDFVMKVTQKHAEETLKRAAEGKQRFVEHSANLLLHMMSQDDVTPEEALVQISDVFYGGVHTVSNTLSFALYHVARHPNVQERLQEEIDREFPPGSPWTPDLLARMPYIKAVLKETLRVTPTLGLNNRRLPEDIVLKGYRIPAGYEIILNHGVVGWLPEYFDRAEEFIPERWMKGWTGRQYHPFAVLPFGFGPRMCLGRRMAEQEISLALTKILQTFNIEYHHEDIGQVSSLANRPDKPVRLALSERR